MINQGLKEGTLYKAVQDMRVHNIRKGDVVYLLKVGPLVFETICKAPNVYGLTADVLTNNSVRAIKFRTADDYGLRAYIARWLAPVLPHD